MYLFRKLTINILVKLKVVITPENNLDNGAVCFRVLTKMVNLVYKLYKILSLLLLSPTSSSDHKVSPHLPDASETFKRLFGV